MLVYHCASVDGAAVDGGWLGVAKQSSLGPTVAHIRNYFAAASSIIGALQHTPPQQNGTHPLNL
jgi:hypothetical protein